MVQAGAALQRNLLQGSSKGLYAPEHLVDEAGPRSVGHRGPTSELRPLFAILLHRVAPFERFLPFLRLGDAKLYSRVSGPEVPTKLLAWSEQQIC